MIKITKIAAGKYTVTANGITTLKAWNLKAAKRIAVGIQKHTGQTIEIE